MEFELNPFIAPINAEFSYDRSGNIQFVVQNSTERIQVDQIRLTADSLIITLPVYGSVLKLVKESDELLTGYYASSLRPDHQIPVNMQFGNPFRFTPSTSTQILPARYKVSFINQDSSSYPAILTLQNTKGSLEATFMTETGDFRYLQGNIMNDRVYLSTFDGSHLFYFEAHIHEGKLTHGIFRSGLHYQASWEAAENDTFMLSNPEHITTIVDPNRSVLLRLPDPTGDTITWNSLEHPGYVIVLDIMGSWCPNCYDANMTLNDIVKQFNTDRLLILPIAFEYTSDFTEAKPKIEAMLLKTGNKPNYLFGGKASKQISSALFPMLSGIKAYPTFIVIDKQGKIAHTYSGFYGPGTGIYHDQFKERFTSILDSLLKS